MTPARVALGRAGVSLPTEALLAFTLDHARARDAVHAPFDTSSVIAGIEGLGLSALLVASRAGDRATYLRRPDLGRRLDEASRARVAEAGEGSQLAIVVGDGLSPTAVHAHAIALLQRLVPLLDADQIGIGQVAVAVGARVALGDEIGELLRARMVLVLLGERPGLSAPDSLGAYLALGPRIGLTDADRNCVSNIHRSGLGYDEAAVKIAWLVREALTRGISGVALKDNSGGRTPQLIAATAALHDK